MLLSSFTPRNFIFIALFVLLNVPCSVKRDLKQSVTSQQVKPEHHRLTCSSFYQLQKQIKKEKAEMQILPLLYASGAKKIYFALEKIIQLPDFYNRQKEKIPSHILFDRFLI